MKNYFVHPNRAKENVDGPFYTVDIGCDCACLMPEQEAPDLLKTTEDRRHQTYFYKQPHSEEEIQKAIEAISVCGIHDIRYGGKDTSIIKRIASSQTDYQITTNGSIKLAHKNT